LPIIIEILGVSGAGKSTLAAHLKERLSTAGIRTVLSRDAARQKVGLPARLAGTALTAMDSLRLAKHFFRSGDSKRYVLVAGTPRRLARAARHGRFRRILARGMNPETVIVQEPGWPMQLLGHYQRSQQQLRELEARKFLAFAPRADTVIVLASSPEVALGRLLERRRGVPRLMRGLSEPELAEAIIRGTKASRVIANAARSLGIETYEINVTSLDADEVAERVNSLVLSSVLARLNASRCTFNQTESGKHSESARFSVFTIGPREDSTLGMIARGLNILV